jgi:hypothetical protein
MKIESFTPQVPRQIRMEFDRNDGWAIIAAINEYAEKYPQAVEVEKWKRWASDLDKELRK